MRTHGSSRLLVFVCLLALLEIAVAQRQQSSENKDRLVHTELNGAAAARNSAVTSLGISDQGLSLAVAYPPVLMLSRFPHQNFRILITNTTDHELSFFVHNELLLLELYDADGRRVSYWGADAKPRRLSLHDLITLKPRSTMPSLLQFGMTPLRRLQRGAYSLHATLLNIPSQWPKEAVRRDKRGKLHLWHGSRVQSPDAKIWLAEKVSSEGYKRKL